MDTESPIPTSPAAYDSEQLTASLNRVTASINRVKRLLHTRDRTQGSPHNSTDYSTPERPGMGAPMSIHLQSSISSGIGGESSGYSSGYSTPSVSGTPPSGPSSSSSNTSSSGVSYSVSGTPQTQPSSNSSSSSGVSYSGSGGNSSGLSTPSASGTPSTRPSSSTSNSSNSTASYSSSRTPPARPSNSSGGTSSRLSTPTARGTPSTQPSSNSSSSNGGGRVTYSGSGGTPGTSSTSRDASTSTPGHSTTPTTTTTTPTAPSTAPSSGSSGHTPSGSGGSTGGGSSARSLPATPTGAGTSGGGYRRRYVPKTKCVQTSPAFGYDCKWVGEPPYSLICPICLCIARRPRQRNCCGSIYCTRCLLMYNKQANYTPGKVKECPNCRRPSADFSDRRAELEINQLMVSCDNTENGCQWTGELSHLRNHMNGCDYVLVNCTECGHSVLRRNYMSHHRTCLEKRKKVEPPKPMPPRTVLAQPVFKLEGYSRYKESGTSWYSSPFYLHPTFSYKMCVRVSFGVSLNYSEREEKVTFSLHLMKGEDDDKLSWPLKLFVTFTLLNQHHDGQHYINTASFQAEQVTEGDKSNGCILMEFKRPPNDRTIDLRFYHSRNDTLYFKIEVRYKNDDCGTPLPWLSPVIK